MQAYSSKSEGGVLRYINKSKSRNGIRLPKTCGYQNCDEETGFNVRAIFARSYFTLPVLYNVLYNFYWNFTILPVCLSWKDI